MTICPVCNAPIAAGRAHACSNVTDSLQELPADPGVIGCFVPPMAGLVSRRELGNV